MTKEMEREIKLLVTQKDLPKLLANPVLVKAKKNNSQKTLHILNWYYDTKDLRLKKQGLAYRIRKTEERYEATVKTKGHNQNGFSARGEYTVPLTAKEPVIKGFDPKIDHALSRLLMGTDLEELFSVEVTRQICLLTITPKTTLEMAIDKGEIRTLKGNAPIDEVELEIKEGLQEDLFAFVKALKEEINITEGTESKWQRGMLLMAGRGK